LSLAVALAAWAFNAPRLAAAVNNRTTAFLLNNDIRKLQGWSRFAGDHPMEAVIHSTPCGQVQAGQVDYA
jgi:hypothetical protein